MQEEEEKRFPKKSLAAIYAGIAGLGIAIYIGWGIMYNSWNIFDWTNAGIYSTTVVLVGIGVVGAVLYSLPEEE